MFTLDPSDTWRLFISGKDTSKLDAPILKWWGSAEVVPHDVESESIWFVSSDGERVISCLKDNKSTEVSIQLPYHALLLWTCKADIVLKGSDGGSLSLYMQPCNNPFDVFIIKVVCKHPRSKQWKPDTVYQTGVLSYFFKY